MCEYVLLVSKRKWWLPFHEKQIPLRPWLHYRRLLERSPEHRNKVPTVFCFKLFQKLEDQGIKIFLFDA
jgi:hypothetical protein